MPNLFKVRVSLKGRPMRAYTFNKKSISIGRDPASDIFLDNTGISRAHARIERTPGGYVVEDLGSANGTFLNEQQIQRDYVGHDDVLRIGKFALWIGLRVERYPFGLLTMIVSLEAIFLSTFVMISQNRADEKRQVLADNQWEIVQAEEAQNEQLIQLSTQILELTKAIHELTVAHAQGTGNAALPPEPPSGS